MENSAKDYLNSLLDKYKTNNSNMHQVLDHFKPIIQSWAKEYFLDYTIMGSIANGTSIKKEEDADVDTLITLHHEIPYDLEYLYNNLYQFLTKKKIKLEKRNISMRTNYKGINVDFVVGVKQPGNTYDHYVWSKRENIEKLSNTHKHVEIVKRSKRQKEIKLLKLWATNNKVKLDGFLAALLVIEALKGKPKEDIENNFLVVLHYLADKFIYVDFKDPSNEKDSISDNLTYKERLDLVKAAKKSLTIDNWNDILEP